METDDKARPQPPTTPKAQSPPEPQTINMTSSDQLAAQMESSDTTDFEDKVLFSRYFGAVAPEVDTIIRIKNNDPELTHAAIHVERLDEVALKRLGLILGNNTTLTNFEIRALNGPNTTQSDAQCWLATGLQPNRSIKVLTARWVRFRDNSMLKCLGPFVVDNPCLEEIHFASCSLGVSDVNFLAERFVHRSTSTLVELNLSMTLVGFVGVDLRGAAEALGKYRRLRRLDLSANGLYDQAVAPFARLIVDNSTDMEELNLSANPIGPQVIATFMDALDTNSRVKTLNLSCSFGMKDGEWATMLPRVKKLVFGDLDTSSNILSRASSIVKSNHTLSSITMRYDPLLFETQTFPLDLLNRRPELMVSFFNRHMGSRDAGIMCLSFGINNADESNEAKARKKIAWLLINKDLEAATDQSIGSLMPYLISCIGRVPDLSLCALYRIFSVMPELCEF